MPYMIGITGESGVGKSTIAEIISLFFGTENTTILSTDDLHKWERDSHQWRDVTHLNPEANNLELGDIHLSELANGRSIFRSFYNHTNGYFNAPVKVFPKQVVIIEGLHAFHTETSKKLLDLKIFIDTHEDLRVHWKIIRDTDERGYAYNTTLETIKKRRIDEHIISSSKNDADVVIHISTLDKISNIGDKYEDINLVITYTLRKKTREDIFEFIQKYFEFFGKFKLCSEVLGPDILICQDAGGNISSKVSNRYMIIKSSGFALKDCTKMNGYSIIDYKSLVFDQYSFEDSLLKSVVSSRYKRPSMEGGFHALLKTHVVHAHPIYLTLLLCLEKSENIIAGLFGTFNYEYIRYIHPGFHICTNINNTDKDIYFLENHGVIVSSNDMKFAINLMISLNDKAKYYLQQNPDFQEFSLDFAQSEPDSLCAFPDAVVFLHDKSKKGTLAAHNYINSQGPKFGVVRHLSADDVVFIRNLEYEKYRTTL